MKTITQYKEDIRVLMAKSAEKDAKAVNENRDLTEAELNYKNEVMDTVKEYQDIIKTMERQERMTAELESPEPALTEPAPDKRAPITARDKDKFNSFGAQMSAVFRAGSGGAIDPRLRNISAAATGLGEAVPSDGGFLVQQDFSEELLQDVFKTGILANRCRRIPISGNANGIKINGVDETSRASTRSGGILAYWEDEAAEKTASKPQFRKIELSLKKMIGLCYATDELLDDVASLESVIRTGFASEFGFRLDDAIINGTGAGQPLGVLSAGSLVSVTKETGQDADTVVTENIIKMYARRFASQTGNYVWLYNQEIEPQLWTMSLAVGAGGIPVFMPAGGLSDAPYARIMGLPAMAIEQAAAIGDVGDIMLANFRDGYILGEKGGIQTDMSIHVRFIYDESVFRFVLRVDGQPVRASALTPYKGGSDATQSHFITIAAR